MTLLIFWSILKGKALVLAPLEPPTVADEGVEPGGTASSMDNVLRRSL
jgi:hypothetical protein